MNDAFERVPEYPLNPLSAPSPVGGQEPTKLIPDYALENPVAPGQASTGDGSEGDPVQAVAADGKLGLVQKHSTWSPPTAFPSALGVDDTPIEIRLDLDGIRMYGTALAKLLNIHVSDLTEDMQIISEDNGLGGTRLVIASGPAYPGSGSGPCQFDITYTAGTATFRAGTINQLLPSNYLSGVAVSGAGTWYLVLDCTASNGEVTSAAFAVDASPPPAITPYAGEPPVAFKVLIGIVISGVAFKVWGCGNITAVAAESFRLQKVSPTAGQLPYDVYYTWNIDLA